MEAKPNSQIYTVEIDTDPKTGRIVEEVWRDQYGRLDRLGDLPAIVRYCPTSGLPIDQQWWREGMSHRDNDKPAMISNWPGSEIPMMEAFYHLDRLHRVGGKPAEIWWDNKGRLQEQKFALFGQYHRDDGPAVEYLSVVTGQRLKSCEYWLNGSRLSGSPQPELAPR